MRPIFFSFFVTDVNIFLTNIFCAPGVKKISQYAGICYEMSTHVLQVFCRHDMRLFLVLFVLYYVRQPRIRIGFGIKYSRE